MERCFQALTVALRVLDATCRNRRPDATDLEALKTFAPPLPVDTRPDDMAVEVIKEALKRRVELRSKGAG